MNPHLRSWFAVFFVSAFALPLAAQVNLGPVSIGTTTSASVTLTLPTAATLGGIQVLTQGLPDLDYTLTSGGSCTSGNAYRANDTCTVEAEFTPKYPGVRSGAVVLSDGSGALLTTVYLMGIGSGPQTTFSAGAEKLLANGLFIPFLLLDENGNIYVAPANGSEITQETPSTSGYIQSTFSLNGRVGPMAIDGAGNFFVNSPGTLYKETRISSGYVESTVVSGMDQSIVSGVAVDGNGNLYLVNYPSPGEFDVVMESPGANGYASSVLFSSTFNCNPDGGVALGTCSSPIAVDASGNVFVTLTSQVLELSPSQGSYTAKWIVSGLNYAADLAIDAAENLFIADTGNARVLKETPSNGSYIQSVVPSQPLAYPTHVALDQTGNVYVVDTPPANPSNNLLIQQLLKENYSTPPSLTFATTSPGVTSSDSPRPVAVTNDGTTSLHFSGVTYPRDFPETLKLPGACTSSTILMAGANCMLTVNFTPESLPGNDANPYLARGNVTVLTDALNSPGAKQNISVYGEEARAVNSLYISSNQNPSRTGSSVAFVATVAGASAGLAPTGSVTFLYGASTLATIPLTSGVAIFSTTSLPTGTDTIYATYSGDSVYTSATSNSVTQIVGKSVPSVILSSSSSSSYVGTPIQFTAIVAGVPSNSNPTGTVNFSSGTTNLGSAPIISGSAILPISFPAAGTQTVTATYSGDSNYISVASLNGINATLTLAKVFGSAPPLIAGSTTLVTMTFPGVATLTSISVFTLGVPNMDFTNAGGGTCSVGTAYAQGATCTVNVAFNPTHAGIHSGAVAIMDSTSSTVVVSTVYLQGTLDGPQLAFSSNPFNSLGAVPIYPNTTLTTYAPGGVAVDPSGNIFVAAVGTGVTKWTLVNGVYTQTAVTVLGGPGIAIDGSGNLFVTCSATLCKFSPQPDGSYSQTTAAAGFNSLFGVAIDGAGNLYLTDSAVNAVYEETLQPDGTYLQSAIGTGWQSVNGLALDASGDISVTNPYLSVIKETLSGGEYIESTVSSTILSPVSVTFDPSGTIFVAGNTYWLNEGDGCSTTSLPPAGGQGLWQETPASGNTWLQTQIYTGSSEQVILNDNATGDLYLVDTGLTPNTCFDVWGELYTRSASIATPLTFGSVAFGSTSSSQAISIYNQGNKPLAFASIHFPTDFPESTGVATECKVGTPLAPAATCTLTAMFQPATGLHSGVLSLPLSESITLSTNSLAVTRQNVGLSGTETPATAASPVFSLPAGNYSSPQTITITDATPGASIYYTTNGMTPTPSSQRYVGTITVLATETVEAIAVATGYINSDIASATYNITPTVAIPIFSIAPGTYTSTQSLSITDATSGATIYYTTNGTTPTTSSQKYGGAITIVSTETLEAIAVAPGYANSTVASATYTITAAAATPTFSVASGTYTSAQNVTIADATTGATIYYTTNGTTPTTSSSVYIAAIAVSTSQTIKAIAVSPGYSTSAVASATFMITPLAATPALSPSAGTYTSVQSVTITDATNGAAIYFTTDGTIPTTSSTLYKGAISVSATETIQVIATASGFATSAIASATYTINLPPPDFSISVSQPSLTIAPGQSGTVTISLTPQNGFASATTFSCSGQPANVTCTFLPASVIPSGGVATTTLTVASSNASTVHPNAKPRFGKEIPGDTLAIALCFLGWRRRRSVQMWLLLIAMSVFGVTLLSGCGGSSLPKPITSNVSVIATSGTLQQTVPLSITIQ